MKKSLEEAAGTLHLHELSQLLTVFCENTDRGWWLAQYARYRVFICSHQAEEAVPDPLLGLWHFGAFF